MYTLSFFVSLPASFLLLQGYEYHDTLFTLSDLSHLTRKQLLGVNEFLVSCVNEEYIWKSLLRLHGESLFCRVITSGSINTHSKWKLWGCGSVSNSLTLEVYEKESVVKYKETWKRKRLQRVQEELLQEWIFIRHCEFTSAHWKETQKLMIEKEDVAVDKLRIV